jgi:hypothetical protein
VVSKSGYAELYELRQHNSWPRLNILRSSELPSPRAVAVGLKALAISTSAFAAPGLLLQFLNLFRSFRFSPIFVEFFPSFAAQRLHMRAPRANYLTAGDTPATTLAGRLMHRKRLMVQA